MTTQSIEKQRKSFFSEANKGLADLTIEKISPYLKNILDLTWDHITPITHSGASTTYSVLKYILSVPIVHGATSQQIYPYNVLPLAHIELKLIQRGNSIHPERIIGQPSLSLALQNWLIPSMKGIYFEPFDLYLTPTYFPPEDIIPVNCPYIPTTASETVFERFNDKTPPKIIFIDKDNKTTQATQMGICEIKGTKYFIHQIS